MITTDERQALKASACLPWVVGTNVEGEALPPDEETNGLHTCVLSHAVDCLEGNWHGGLRRKLPPDFRVRCCLGGPQRGAGGQAEDTALACKTRERWLGRRHHDGAPLAAGEDGRRVHAAPEVENPQLRQGRMPAKKLCRRPESAATSRTTRRAQIDLRTVRLAELERQVYWSCGCTVLRVRWGCIVTNFDGRKDTYINARDHSPEFKRNTFKRAACIGSPQWGIFDGVARFAPVQLGPPPLPVLEYSAGSREATCQLHLKGAPSPCMGFVRPVVLGGGAPSSLGFECISDLARSGEESGLMGTGDIHRVRGTDGSSACLLFGVGTQHADVKRDWRQGMYRSGRNENTLEDSIFLGFSDMHCGVTTRRSSGTK
ncbi:hypothetical protein FB451DRAFT_1172978 [Mycena latifolia]|nr:hypothetical protein FB451DRAFT_1172978 [Mycena latifolia]